MTEEEPARLNQFARYHRVLSRPRRAWRDVPPLAKEGAAILAIVVFVSALTGGLVGAFVRL